MSKLYTAEVRPLIGRLFRIAYTSSTGERRAQAWYSIGTLTWGHDGSLGVHTEVERCPWVAAHKSAAGALQHLRRSNRTNRKRVEREVAR